MSEDPDCICRGNWRLIVAECEELLDKQFVDENGDVFVFYGIVHGSDDYYYGMTGRTGHRLLSCVGSLETHGYKLAETAHEQLSIEEQCRMFCAWKGGGPCISLECPRRNSKYTP